MLGLGGPQEMLECARGQLNPWFCVGGVSEGVYAWSCGCGCGCACVRGCVCEGVCVCVGVCVWM